MRIFLRSRKFRTYNTKIYKVLIVFFHYLSVFSATLSILLPLFLYNISNFINKHTVYKLLSAIINTFMQLQL